MRTLDRGAVITLTDEEVRIAGWIGHRRTEVARLNGIHRYQTRGNGRTAEEIDVDGFGAELAFCKLVNVYPDLSPQPKSGGADCLVVGSFVDVKSRRQPFSDLLVVARPGKQTGIDWYALMIVNWPEFRFAGAIPTLDLVKQPVVDLGYGPTYAVPQTKLGDFRLTLTPEQVEEYAAHAVKADEIRWTPFTK
jgi:hypothetical protein